MLQKCVLFLGQHQTRTVIFTSKMPKLKHNSKPHIRGHQKYYDRCDIGVARPLADAHTYQSFYS